ncbi:hypothetical protein EII14_05410 [Alloprevotella sp. OH1205_COT-284]|uniref:hypothetical protein n=1 Tax=Alloprevotella sp. OH1205_COT-284 TaxID=2491043 RepID=UPI000F5F71F2|nr:hypothetical protein [Alloprevotella sp. OH1205_COT-284]RRD79798.1 hypothetical protein EII14_05410 [Alloprevotella sp. OH1205_COT-284]
MIEQLPFPPRHLRASRGICTKGGSGRRERNADDEAPRNSRRSWVGGLRRVAVRRGTFASWESENEKKTRVSADFMVQRVRIEILFASLSS